MSFDWQSFLDGRGIAYKRSGHEARVVCPFCDQNDAAEHWWMTISLNGRGWHCWNERQHRGIRATRLVATLLKCSFAEARFITGERYQELDRIDERVQGLLNGAKVEIDAAFRQLPKEFRPFTAAVRQPSLTFRPFVAYLRGRGFDLATIARLTEDYGVYYALAGPQRYRIVFTVVQDRKLRAWSGRTIVKTHDLRYLTSSRDDGPSISDHILWYDRLRRGGDRIAVCEGPFDALKLWTLGLPATCWFTAKPSDAQAALLKELLPRYRDAMLILDQGTLPTALAVKSLLTPIPVRVVQMPAKIKDPALLKSLDFLS